MKSNVPGADLDENVRVPSHTTHAGIFDCELDEQSEIRSVSSAPAVRHPACVQKEDIKPYKENRIWESRIPERSSLYAHTQFKQDVLLPVNRNV